MHQNRLGRLAFCPRPSWESLQRSPEPLYSRLGSPVPVATLRPLPNIGRRSTLDGSVCSEVGSCWQSMEVWRAVDALEQLAEVVLYGGHGGNDRWSAEAVRDQ